MTTTIETLPAGDVTETGELLGDVRGVRFYRLAVIAAVLPDGRVDRIEAEADWRGTVEAELIAARARIAELERRKSGPKPGPKPGTRRALALPAPALAPAPVATPAPSPAPVIPQVAAAVEEAPTALLHGSPRPGEKRPFEEAIAPTRPAPAPVNPPPLGRFPCAKCGRAYDSAMARDAHRCHPVAAPPAGAPAPAAEPEPIVIPTDPKATAAELERLSNAPWPRPCPECWSQGLVALYKGPAGMASHRKSQHGVLPNVGTPIPIRWPDGGVCRYCGSGVFARSFEDDTVCVKCAKEGPPPPDDPPATRARR